MKPVEKTEYYRAARDVLENRTYKQEMQELVRRLYKELSTKAVGKLEQQGYRMCLIALHDFERRLKDLSLLYRPPSGPPTSNL